jgi:hypothetical protein
LVVSGVVIDVDDDGDDDNGMHYHLQETNFTSLWGSFLITCALIFLFPVVEREIPLCVQVICIAILHIIL